MIKTKRIYEKAEDKDGFRVLVDRLWPRGLNEERVKLHGWLKDIAPSTELRRWFRHDLRKWEEFRKRYRAELDQKDEALNLLMRKAEEEDITLLYAAKDTEHNNAVVLKEFLKEKMSRLEVDGLASAV